MFACVRHNVEALPGEGVASKTKEKAGSIERPPREITITTFGGLAIMFHEGS